MKRLINQLWQIINAPNQMIKIIRQGNKALNITVKRKSDLKIFHELLMWFIVHKEVNTYYYRWNFYEKTKDEMKTYVSNKAGQSTVRWINAPRKDVNHIILVKDKFIFGAIAQTFKIPTSTKIGIIKGARLFDFYDLSKEIGYDSLLKKNREFCCKPLAGQNGDGIFFMKVDCENKSVLIHDRILQISQLPSLFKNGSWLIEERVVQHPEMDKLNPDSLNTIRITTINHEGVVKVISAIQRIGVTGMNIDNRDVGGLLLNIDRENGQLSRYGYHKSGINYENHPSSGLTFLGYKLPLFDDAINLAVKSHSYFYGLYTIGWDIAISINGPIVIEANNNWTFGGIQQVEGGLRNLFEETFWQAAPHLKRYG